MSGKEANAVYEELENQKCKILQGVLSRYSKAGVFNWIKLNFFSSVA